jgi:hypothetical protein
VKPEEKKKRKKEEKKKVISISKLLYGFEWRTLMKEREQKEMEDIQRMIKNTMKLQKN